MKISFTIPFKWNQSKYKWMLVSYRLFIVAYYRLEVVDHFEFPRNTSLWLMDGSFVLDYKEDLKSLNLRICSRIHEDSLDLNQNKTTDWRCSLYNVISETPLELNIELDCLIKTFLSDLIRLFSALLCHCCQ